MAARIYGTSMPELPEVEILVRHLDPLLRGKRVKSVQVLRERVTRPNTEAELQAALCNAKFRAVRRRGKYLLFELYRRRENPLELIGHLGMTGRLYLSPARSALPKHAAVVVNLGKENLVFEDTRYFGRMTLDHSLVMALGPEPLSPDFTASRLAEAVARSSQPIKVKLLDQTVVAGIGNIYASEALFRARIAPTRPACRLSGKEMKRLVGAIRQVLTEAIECGSTIPMNFTGLGDRDGLFYFGSAPDAGGFYEERLRVYDRANEPCPDCGRRIKRIVQAARSSFFCPDCQHR